MCVKRTVCSALSIAILCGIPAVSLAQTCSIDLKNPIVIPEDPDDEEDEAKHAYRLPDGSIVFLGALTIDADGAPKAYGPGDSGLDETKNGGHPGNWWGLATDAPECAETGTPLVQGPNDPAPGFYVSTTTMTDPAVDDCTRQRNYVDSGAIPFVALSPMIATIAHNKGKLVVVYRPSNGKIAFALNADTAPAHGIGEGSMLLARDLGADDNPRRGGIDDRELVYLVLPERIGFPASAEALRAAARKVFEKSWGGEKRLKLCKAALDKAPR